MMDLNLILKVVLVVLPLTCAQPEVMEKCRPDNSRHCYTLYGNRTTDFTWYQADAFCKDMGEHLVAIPTKEVEDLLISMLRDATEMLASNYAWTVGQTSNDTRWRNLDGDLYTGYVSASRDVEACGSLYQHKKPSGELAMVVTGQSCNVGKHPLCQIPRETHCLYNEIPIPPYCYRLLDHSASWFDAEVKCEEYAPGAHLAYTHIDDAGFKDTLQLDQAISLGEPTWIGIYMRPWFWRLNECSFDKRNMLYSNWDYVSHSPLGNPPEALAISKAGRWRDYSVTMIHDYFICEKDDGEDGHHLATNCPTSPPEALPTVPLEFPSTTMAPVTDPMDGDDDDDDVAKTKSLSTAALAVAVISIVLAVVCVTGACYAISNLRKSLEKIKRNAADKPSYDAPRGTNGIQIKM